jgi:hypothetical protein
VSGIKYGRRVVVVPEDDANRKLANGFKSHWAVAQRDLVVLPEASGWMSVLEVFIRDVILVMRKNSLLYAVLVLDFDEEGDDRRAFCVGQVPDDLRSRTFLIGTSDEPEDLKRELNLTLEQIGFALADGCNQDDLGLWTHAHLVHNLAEVQRMRPVVHPILFPGA